MASTLPRIFYTSPWPRRLRGDAQALWHWHAGLLEAQAPALDGDDLAAYFTAEQAKVEAGAPVQVLPERVWRPAYQVCEEHGLSLSLLADQVGAARRFQEPTLFATAPDLMAFIHRWATAHGLLLIRLAGMKYSWQERPTDELARGFFLVGRLGRLPQDLADERLFIPLSDLDDAGVALETLRAGRVDDNVRRLLWKQSVRIRDALAQGQALMKELPRRYRNALKRYWVGALEVLQEIERRDYDLWTEPLHLSFFRRLQIRLQAWLGNAASGR